MPICFILFVGTVLAIQIMMRKNKEDFGKTLNDIMTKERKANLSRKKEIDKTLFVVPDKEILPIRDYADTEENKKIIKAQQLAQKKSELTMIRFDEPISNTDLKLKYGLANLDNITIYEEHYNSYMQCLVNWADLLIQRENLTDAEIILKESMRLKCDLSKAYILLIDIYKKTNKLTELKNLISYVENSNINLKSKIINYSKMQEV